MNPQVFITVTPVEDLRAFDFTSEQVPGARVRWFRGSGQTVLTDASGMPSFSDVSNYAQAEKLARWYLERILKIRSS